MTVTGGPPFQKEGASGLLKGYLSRMTAPHVRPAELADIELLADHLQRHKNESGRGGDEVFGTAEFDRAEFCAGVRSALALPVGTRGWARWWALFVDGAIGGHLDLQHSGIPDTGHRARLGLGLEGPYRRQGFGRHLLQVGLSMALEAPGLDWVELGVFAHNVPARRLYESAGFLAIGFTQDFMRIQGQSVDDIPMARSVRS